MCADNAGPRGPGQIIIKIPESAGRPGPRCNKGAALLDPKIREKGPCGELKYPPAQCFPPKTRAENQPRADLWSGALGPGIVATKPQKHDYCVFAILQSKERERFQVNVSKFPEMIDFASIIVVFGTRPVQGFL